MAKILVVDDEAVVREMLREMLESAGHEVDEAGDGAEGLRRFRQAPADLVVTDILMPNKGGLNLIREIKESSADTPCIAISGGGKDGKLNFLSTARTFPGVWTLDKPFTQSGLLRIVDEALT